MASLTQKYFAEGDTLSSTDFNSNASNWDAATKSVDDVNIRDQGLDIQNFKSGCCTEHSSEFADNGATNKIVWSVEFQAFGPPDDVYVINFPDLTWQGIDQATCNRFQNQPSYIFRQDLTWYLPMTGSSSSVGYSDYYDLPNDSFLEIQFIWHFESSETPKTILMTKKIKFRGHQLSMYSGSGNISFSTMLTEDMFNSVRQTNIKIYCNATMYTSYGPDGVFYDGATFDSVVVWNSKRLVLHVDGWNTSLTKYFGAS